MAAVKCIESPGQMTPEYRAMVKELLEHQAYREVMAANLFGDALKYVPTLQYKKLIASQIKEELEHFEEVVALYRDLGGDLEEAIKDRLDRVPFVESWFELAVAQFLYDRAGEFHLKEYRNCSYAPYARIVGKILEEEEGHEGFGEVILRGMCQDPAHRKKAQTLFNKWFAVALLSFGRPGTPGNRYCLEVGLKSQDSGKVMQDFINDLKPTMMACGITFPPPQAVGIEFPADVDFSLSAA